MSSSSRRVLALAALLSAGSMVAVPAPQALADCGGYGPTIERPRQALGTAFTGRFVGFESAEAGIQLLWLVDTVYDGEVPIGAFSLVGAPCDPLVLKQGEQYLFSTGAKQLAEGKASFANSVAWRVDGDRVELAPFLDMANPPTEATFPEEYPAKFRRVKSVAGAMKLVAPDTIQAPPSPSPSGCTGEDPLSAPSGSPAPGASPAAAGCPQTPAAPIVADVQLQPDGAYRPLGVSIADATGHVLAARAMTPEELGQLPLIRDQFLLVASEGSEVHAWWIGSPCETTGTLTIAQEPSMTLDLAPHAACDQRAQLYGLVLEQDAPADTTGWTVRYTPSVPASAPSPTPSASP